MSDFIYTFFHIYITVTWDMKAVIYHETQCGINLSETGIFIRFFSLF